MKTQVNGINIKVLILRCRVELEIVHPNKLHDAADIPGAAPHFQKPGTSESGAASPSLPTYLPVASEEPDDLSFSSVPWRKEKTSMF